MSKFIKITLKSPLKRDFCSNILSNFIFNKSQNSLNKLQSKPRSFNSRTNFIIKNPISFKTNDSIYKRFFSTSSQNITPNAEITSSKLSLYSKVKSYIKFDLGIPELYKDWKLILTNPTTWKADISSGITVAFVAVPLSLAIAMGSGVSPAAGLVTAIMGGAVTSVFGGSPLAVSGPAAALAFVCFEVVHTYGTEGLVLLTFIAGALQLLTGVFKIGSLAKFIPVPVVAGFTSGIGCIVLLQQLPVAMNIVKPLSSHVLVSLPHIVAHCTNVCPTSMTLALFTVASLFILPNISAFKKIPVTLLVVTLCTSIASLLQLDLCLIGTIPNTLPPFVIPNFNFISSVSDFGHFMGLAGVVYGVASVESLISASAVDKLAKNKIKHDPNQELIGQGLANLSSASFGGIPVSCVIVRSSVNIDNGGKTRLASLVHVGVLLGTVFFFSSYMEIIPMACLSGILLATAIRMMKPTELIEIAKISKVDGFICVFTTISIVMTDVMSGVGMGILISAVRLAINQQIGRFKFDITNTIVDNKDTDVVTLNGSAIFLQCLSIGKLSSLIQDLKNNNLILDLTNITHIDITGADMLAEIITSLIHKEIEVTIKCKEEHQLLLNHINSNISSKLFKPLK